ncbi:tetratricopeptide repeat protein [Massilia sp. CF038]|uniref:tetratricopeptide repeat protein n=1 Tax=Massilia sp. CF038 TaxID=1881045 RepID=UPI00091787C0|nr:tetratricopeptide repeat protein [Massilia sp. CF038]SHG97968.1 MSHA biogenesis protein MshN [Massilia sp. CF038]
MSLINKMLQDLDARGSQSGTGMQSEIKPVLVAEPRLPVRQIATAAVLIVFALAMGAWFWLKKPAGPRALTMDAPAANAPTATPPPSVPVPGVAVPATVTNKGVVPDGPKQAPSAPVAVAPVQPEPAGAATVTAPRAPASNAPAKAANKVASKVAPAASTAHNAPAGSTAPTGGRQMTSEQRAERSYREAMTMLDEGRASAAMDVLSQTLVLNPRHEGARQSLVSLLVESGRKAEAMQQLEQGLAADAGQPALAMLLARMQIDAGQSGVATLLRSLPAAAGNGDYHAFLAGALQREQRHPEAIDQYALALRTNPEHGVWLMGMGISLEAEQRNGEAVQAFQRAKASRTLTAPLQEFVDRKLQKLGR